jgi:maltose alpha-D-glucosyltransferase/alpha-amylase
MYQTYAADPRMRVNVGIRRRLAPLLGNDRDKIRLMNSLLLSMPGSPILYYGDELGMGDNIYLGDRNGVRTPMQWSPDRNAGFSRADPERLYLPPIMDPVYGYQSVNAEAQQRDGASLRNWMRRIIAVRKAHRVFGRGTLELLHPGNRKILAYVRRGGEGGLDETLLCVANLAHSAQPVELDLSRFQGRVPVEMLGRTPFPPIGELPYLLTLPGHGFYWFLLSEEAQAPGWHEERLPLPDLLTIVVPEGWASLQPRKAQRPGPAQRALALLEGQALPAYLPTRRWYVAAGGDIARTEIVARQEWKNRLLTLVRVASAGVSSSVFFLPLSIVWNGRGQPEETLAGATAAAALARVRRHAAHGLLCDAFAEEDFARLLVRSIGEAGELPFDSGRLVFSPTTAYERIAGEPHDPSGYRLIEGTHGGAVVDDRLFLKVCRRLNPGIKPEVEMGRFLTEVSPSARIAPLAGAVDYRAADGGWFALAVLQAYVPNQGNLWDRTLDLLDRLCATHGDRLTAWQSDPAQIGYAALLDVLGQRVAELHRALVGPGGGEAFDPEPIDEGDLRAWVSTIRSEAEDTLESLARCPAEAPDGVRRRAEELRGRRGRLIARIAGLAPGRVESVKIRCHGDLHLGHVLVVENDAVFVGFGGRAGRTLTDPRAKGCPLVDLACLIDSLDGAVRNAAAAAAREGASEQPRLAETLGRWGEGMTRRLLTSYERRAEGAPFYPAASGQASGLTRLFELQRALARVRDELANAGQGLGDAIDRVRSLLERDG